MNKTKRLVVLLGLATLLHSCLDVRIKNHEKWAEYFEEMGVEGCFEVFDNNKERVYYYNKDYCSEQFSPGETFAAFLTMTALDVSTALDEQHKFDSAQYPSLKGITLEEAFKNQQTEYFKALSTAITLTETEEYLNKTNYGNRIFDSLNMEDYWINSQLKISPDEQVGFMKRLYHGLLPFTERSQRILRSLMLQKEDSLYKLHYITGFVNENTTNRVWVVGFAETINVLKNVETKKEDHIPHPYFFALNFSTTKTEEEIIPLRDELFEKLMSENGIWK